ncbi:hydrolase TatD [Candidatus Falkowbacteria bacterium CG10_big_fil_rev_8_21_14_0_10_37_6]|uniref:Hydrolase TatD n=1 Tax=Candidatus Falkowbacteria bacterium CG10_big_fil_rev_8_21_14_0_10_37_6 TaxID=1974563 RepID=A0A2H0V7M3_9BACT|nr:MAG: hydrolase TatD [Candidatus Falkowbacteria bacterium CG10_big_fil_rev_8_21_14_0_10_37_6]
MDLIDIHAHLNFQAYRDDYDTVIRRALDENMQIIIPGTDIETSKKAVFISGKYEKNVYAAVGLHPVHLQDSEFTEEGRLVKMKSQRFDEEEYVRLAELDEVVAIGEIGLDYYYLPEDETKIKQNKQLQQLTLLQQLELAYNLDKPVILHCREAHDDLIMLLKNFYKNKKKRLAGRGVIHSFFGDTDTAWKYFALDFLISFTGDITFPPKKEQLAKYEKRDELLRKMPLDKFMVETDSPFLTPIPNRGKRNEPTNVKYVADRIAQKKKTSFTKIEKATADNAKRLFDI